LLHGVGFTTGRNHSDNLRSHEFGVLDGRGAYTAGRAGNQNALIPTHVASKYYRNDGGHEGRAYRRSHNRIELIRYQEAIACRANRNIRKCPEEGLGGYAISNLEVGHARPGADNSANDIPSKEKWKLWPALILSLSDQQIRKIQRCCLCRNKHVVAPR
jgi:hypothetical protein